MASTPPSPSEVDSASQTISFTNTTHSICTAIYTRPAQQKPEISLPQKHCTACATRLTCPERPQSTTQKQMFHRGFGPQTGGNRRLPWARLRPLAGFGARAWGWGTATGDWWWNSAEEDRAADTDNAQRRVDRVRGGVSRVQGTSRHTCWRNHARVPSNLYGCSGHRCRRNGARDGLSRGCSTHGVKPVCSGSTQIADQFSGTSKTPQRTPAWEVTWGHLILSGQVSFNENPHCHTFLGFRKFLGLGCYLVVILRPAISRLPIQGTTRLRVQAKAVVVAHRQAANLVQSAVLTQRFFYAQGRFCLCTKFIPLPRVIRGLTATKNLPAWGAYRQWLRFVPMRRIEWQVWWENPVPGQILGKYRCQK